MKTGSKIVVGVILAVALVVVTWRLGWRCGAMQVLRQDEILLTDLALHAPESRHDVLTLQLKASARGRIQQRELLLQVPWACSLGRQTYKLVPMSREAELKHIKARLDELDEGPEPQGGGYSPPAARPAQPTP